MKRSKSKHEGSFVCRKHPKLLSDNTYRFVTSLGTVEYTLLCTLSDRNNSILLVKNAYNHAIIMKNETMSHAPKVSPELSMTLLKDKIKLYRALQKIHSLFISRVLNIFYYANKEVTKVSLFATLPHYQYARGFNKFIFTDRAFPEALIVEIGRQICEGLSVIHAQDPPIVLDSPIEKAFMFQGIQYENNEVSVWIILNACNTCHENRSKNRKLDMHNLYKFLNILMQAPEHRKPNIIVPMSTAFEESEYSSSLRRVVYNLETNYMTTTAVDMIQNFRYVFKHVL